MTFVIDTTYSTDPCEYQMRLLIGHLICLAQTGSSCNCDKLLAKQIPELNGKLSFYLFG